MSLLFKHTWLLERRLGHPTWFCMLKLCANDYPLVYGYQEKKLQPEKSRDRSDRSEKYWDGKAPLRSRSYVLASGVLAGSLDVGLWGP